MSTPAEDAAVEYANWCAKLAELSADPRPSYTVPGGASMNFIEYYRFLQEARDKARLAMVAASGPFTVVSVVR